jgi:hypothetical protein
MSIIKKAVTEPQARLKWCPFISGYLDKFEVPHTTRISLASQEKFANCIASDCMAWRFNPGSETHGVCGLVHRDL